MSKLPIKRRQQARTPKVIIAGMTKVLECFADLEGEWLAGKSTTIVLNTKLDFRYLAGLLNSKLVTHYFVTEYGGNCLQGGYLRIGPPQVKTIPIAELDISNKEEKTLHDRIVSHVEKLTAALRQRQEPTTPHSRHVLDKLVGVLERQLDRLVYEAYRVTEEEIVSIEATYANAAGAQSADPDDDE
jgi:hypothetical protein